MRKWLGRQFGPLAIGVLMCLSAYSPLAAQTPAALEQQLVATTDGIARQTLFHQLIVAYQHISIDTALEYSQQALREARALGNDSLLAKAHLRMCPFYLYKGEVDAALAHAELAQQIGSRMSSLATTSSAYQLMANAYYHQGDAARAISYNRRSLAGYSSLKHAVGIRVLRGNLANLYAETGKLDSALLQAIAYEEVATQTAHIPSQGRAALLLSKIYSELDQKEKSKDYLYQAKAIFSQDGYPSQRANTLSLLANMHQEEGQVDSAIYYHLAALDINQTLENPGNIATVEGELGIAYLEAKQWQAAYTYLHKSVRANRALGQEVGLAHNYLGLARYFSAQPTTDSVLFYLDKSLEAARLHKVAAVEGEALQALVRFHEAENDYRRALLYHKQYLEFLNATRGLETEKTIASLEAKYETEKKERRIERLELQAVADNSRNNALKMGLVGSILVFGMLAAALWYRRKNEQQLFAFQQQMHEQEKKELDQQLIFKTKELTSHALHMVQKNKVLQELKRSISALSKNAQATDKKALRAITRRIDTNIQSDEDWNTFRLYFEQINQNFYHQLGEISRELTPTELKLCSLIKLNMNIKETASVLNIEPSSVKTARHRLRKKLGLQQGEDLASFIRQIV